MKLAVDFHIHTALSPCADKDMTPNNIVNMSILKGLDAIAITDHNSIENCGACIELSQDKDILVIPGMELQTKEEIHLVCLFRNIESASQFQSIVYSRLKEENIPEIFGRQLIFDKEDNIIGENKKMLIASADISVNEAFDKVRKQGGIIFPAHIDRSGYSIIANLGFIPANLPMKVVEISKRCDLEKLISENKYLLKYQFLRNSDAHYLADIMERENFIEVKRKSIESIFEALL
ncbi:MAG TPA: PHP domain-containing protein [Clostridiales bacterium]|nr:PHP domain-containing protein [Clostridiales bacterium]